MPYSGDNNGNNGHGMVYPKWTCRRYIQPMYPIDDVIKMRNLHALFQAVVLKNRNRPKRRQTGAGYLVLVDLIIDSRSPCFLFWSCRRSDLSSSHFLSYCLPGALHLIKLLVISISFFHPLCIASQLHFNWPIRKKGSFFSVTSYYVSALFKNSGRCRSLFVIVYDLCLTIQPGTSLLATRYLILFYFFWFVRGTI